MVGLGGVWVSKGHAGRWMWVVVWGEEMLLAHPECCLSLSQARLADLHTGAILHNIALRYHKDDIYTYIGSILSAINPYKRLEVSAWLCPYSALRCCRPGACF